MRRFQLIFWCLVITGTSFAQQKFERESRLRNSELPTFAQEFTAKFERTQKIKWFLEEGFHGESIEAKYKREGRHLSVEFDSTGRIEDVEVLMDFNDIPASSKERIKKQFSDQSQKYKVGRMQIQFTGEQSALLQSAFDGLACEGCTVRYEIVVRMKQNDTLKSFEYLFDEAGEFIQRSEIIIQTASNLEY